MPIGVIERALHLHSRIRTRLFTLLLATQFKEFGTGSRVTPPFRFYGLNRMAVGENVTIHRDCWLQTIPDNNDRGAAQLTIQSNAGIGMGAQISAAQKVLLEEYVFLGRNVYISDHAHAFQDKDIPIVLQGINRIAPVTVGRGTWLGQNVVVLPGVTIGRHCVIGANSVVNSSIPDYSVALGAPARVAKQYNPKSQQWERTPLANQAEY
jgi:acetyltransferase-like isoleucine patch superfamily enzyme